MTSPEVWGVAPGYHDVAGRWHEPPRETVTALLSAMGANGTPPEGRVLVVRHGEERAIEGHAQLVTEDGASHRVAGALPASLPPGYYTLREEGGHDVRLIVGPAACHLPEDFHAWGFAVQVYSVRSQASWGIGDLADVQGLARLSRDLGAGILLLSPLHAPAPVEPQEPSPYYASSRCFRNPLYIRVEDVPGAADLGDIRSLAEKGKALNSQRRIDHAEVFRLKMAALSKLWDLFEGSPAFDAYCRAEGDLLESFATFSALAEHYATGWRAWPAPHRHPARREVERFRSARQDRVRFHKWLQWLLDVQLARAAEEISLVQDLAVGCDPDGADGWLWQDFYLEGVRVGAPPDDFNTEGQDWGVAPFDPWKLREAAYEPFIRALRACLRHARGLRVDHVMGLFRLYCIPAGAGAREGAYIRYSARDLLSILALESERAGAYVVGEDLGTVEDEVRGSLHETGVLSYRLLWFEDPSAYPAQALAGVETHDLPTIAGLLTGADMADQRASGVKVNEALLGEMRERLARATGLDDAAQLREVVVRAHAALAKTEAMIVTASLEDALGVEERPNLPGTTGDRRANWSLALPVALEDLGQHELVRAVAAALTRD